MNATLELRVRYYRGLPADQAGLEEDVLLLPTALMLLQEAFM